MCQKWKKSGIKEVYLSLERLWLCPGGLSPFEEFKQSNFTFKYKFIADAGVGVDAVPRAGVSAYLRVGYLRGFLGQTAALRGDQVIVLSADILIWVVQASRTGPRWRPEEKKQEAEKECQSRRRESKWLYKTQMFHLIIIIIFYSGKLKTDFQELPLPLSETSDRWCDWRRSDD